MVATLLWVVERQHMEARGGKGGEKSSVRQPSLPLLREQLLLKDVVDRPPWQLKVRDVDALLRLEESNSLIGRDIDETSVHAGKDCTGGEGQYRKEGRETGIDEPESSK